MSKCLISFRFTGALFFLWFVIAGCESSDKTDSPTSADLVIENGVIYTVNDDEPWAQAIAIKDGRITFVGSDDDVKEYIGSNTKIVDADNKLIIPGMQDVHIHPISGGILSAACDLNGLSNIAEYRTAISSYANANPGVEWILGGGWAMKPRATMQHS